MVETIPATEITIRQLNHIFNLERTDDPQFFQEWQDELPELTDLEKERLDEVKDDYLYLSQSLMLETVVKMVVLSPLLRMAGFYRPPFEMMAEKEIRLASDDEETIVTGRIDILVFRPDFWVTVVEAKRAKYALHIAIPQALAYMLGNPHVGKDVLGFVTNGSEFRFLKLSQQTVPKYGRSQLFSIDRGDDFYVVLRILKRFAQLVS